MMVVHKQLVAVEGTMEGAEVREMDVVQGLEMQVAIIEDLE